MGPKRNIQRYIIIKLTKVKDKERILKAAREKQRVTYKGVPIRLSGDFSNEILQARRDWQKVFKVMKSKDLHTRLLYPIKLSFRIEDIWQEEINRGRNCDEGILKEKSTGSFG